MDALNSGIRVFTNIPDGVKIKFNVGVETQMFSTHNVMIQQSIISELFNTEYIKDMAIDVNAVMCIHPSSWKADCGIPKMRSNYRNKMASERCFDRLVESGIFPDVTRKTFDNRVHDVIDAYHIALSLMKRMK